MSDVTLAVLAEQLKNYTLGRARLAALDPDPMGDLRFSLMEGELAANAAAREMCSYLLLIARRHANMMIAVLRPSDMASVKQWLEGVVRSHVQLDNQTLKQVTWGQTRLSLTARKNLDGVALIAKWASDYKLGVGFVEGVFAEYARRQADREVDDTTPRQIAELLSVGGTATNVGCGVYALGVILDVVLHDGVHDDLDKQYSTRQAAQHNEKGNDPSFAVGTELAAKFAEEFIREIVTGSLAGAMAIVHPSWSHGFYVAGDRSFVRLPDVCLQDYARGVACEFEASLKSPGRGASSELAIFLASLITTLGGLVSAGATGALEVRGETVRVEEVGGITDKLEAAAAAGLGFVLTPMQTYNRVPGVTAVPVSTTSDAVWQLLNRAAKKL